METNNNPTFVPRDTMNISFDAAVVEMLELIKCPTDVLKQGLNSIISWLADTYKVINNVINNTIAHDTNDLYIGYVFTGNLVFETYIIKSDSITENICDTETIHITNINLVSENRNVYNYYLDNLYNIHLLYSCAYVLTNILNKVDHEDK
jgi:hypothetical protein